MNYNKIYDKLIKTRQQLIREKNNDGLLESHHIIPKCFGGNNTKENLVLLTPREHYVAHWLLYKIYFGKDKAKMAYAFFMMCKRNPNQKRFLTSREYHRAKENMTKSCTGVNHPGFGEKIWSDEQKKEISIRMSGENNPRFGKAPWNKGLTKESNEILLNISMNSKGIDVGFGIGCHHTETSKRKISAAHKGKKLSDVTKQKLSIFNKGKKLSDVTKKRMSEARKGISQQTIICPYCQKCGGISAMKRWHFGNCKNK